MWSDNETDLDLLNVTYLVSAVTETVLHPNLLPVTVGVFGDWGSGKSSILRMVREEFKDKKDILCISFNGWLFEGYEDAKAALMGTILDEIRSRPKLSEKAKKLFRRLAKRVDWFSLMGMVTKYAATFTLSDSSLMLGQIGGDIAQTTQNLAAKAATDLPGTIEGAKEALDDDDQTEKESVRKNVREFRGDFAELLKETNIKTLVIFIDDLDRCLPDTVIETLEAVRLFLFVPGTAFIIGADERLVEQAVQHRFPDSVGTKSELSRNYLEKLVQVPVRIPPLGPNEVRSYMNLLFAQLRLGDQFEEVRQKIPKAGQDGYWDLILDYGWFKENADQLPNDLTEDLDLTERIGDVLAEMLSGNPRQVKRFLNALVLRMRMSETRGVKLKQGILAKLMVLEYKSPESFGLLAQLQGQQEGKPIGMETLERKARKKEEGNLTSEKGESNDSTPGSGNRKGVARKTKKELPPLNDELSAWLKDDWLMNWLCLEPSLAGEDLRPYFYVSRDRIGPIAGPRLQLSPAAQKVFENLISGSAAERASGITSAKTLSNADASAVLQALVDRTLKAEEHTGDHAPVNVLIQYGEARPELISEGVRALRRIPEVRLGPGVPSRLAALKKLSPTSANLIDEQLREWAQSADNTVLARAAGNILKR